MVKRYIGGIISAIFPTVTNSSASGMFSATQAMQYTQNGAWAARPGAPTEVTGAAGGGQVTVSFTPPTNNGGSAITSYTVTSTPGNFTATGASSPLVVTGLTNGTSYTFTVTATNALGAGPASAPSGSVTPTDADFTITPSVGGVTNWKFSVNGSLSIASAGEYTINWYSTTSKVVKVWGGGGKSNSEGSTNWGAGAGGGAAVGTVSFVSGNTYKLRIGAAGSTGTAPATAYGAGNGGGAFTVGNAGSGGGYSGIFLTTVTQGNALLMAGGGGGGASDRGDGLGGRAGYAGGGTTGQTSGGDFQAGSGTQSAGGGAAGSGSPTSGSALQGGNGSNGGGGGGGGYFGGGGGGSQGDGGYGGGGGSGYFQPSAVTSATLYTGSFGTPGNNTDVDRPTNAGAGNVAAQNSFPGAIIIKA